MGTILGVRALLDLLVPERCACCGRHGLALCRVCRELLTPLRPPLCERCGAPVAWPVERCRECAGRRLWFSRSRAAIGYEAAAVRLVGAWKEGGRRALAREAAGCVVALVPRPAVAAVVAVPPVADRLLWRGHNPAQGLAAELASAWQLPLLPGLVRRRATPRQRDLTRRDRQRSVASAFGPGCDVPSAVALIDDVYTTGSTASAAAKALRRGGAVEIHVVTFARALRGGSTGRGYPPSPAGPRIPVNLRSVI